MKPSELLQYAIVAAIIGMIVLLLLSQLLGQPFIVFVETGSMAPTLEPNDGYLAVPSFFVGSIEEGDVILFDAQELGGGELTTHRVVGQTEQGYITQGDANPFTDQDGSEPPVADGQIRSVAVQVNGNLVVIPGLGASVGTVTGVGESFQERFLVPLGIDTDVTTLSTIVLVGGLLLFIYSTITGSTDKRARSRSKGSLLENAFVIIAILTLVVIIPVNFSMLLPSGVYQYEILSSTSPTDDEQIIQAGGSSDVTYFMRNSGHLPVVVFLEPAGDGVDIHEEMTYVPRRTTIETSITMHAPEQTGTYLRFVREYRYLVVLPPSLIASLHAIHPVVALAVINLWVATIVIVVSVLSVGTGRVRLRSRSRELSIGEEIRRKLPLVAVGSSRSGPRSGSTRVAPTNAPPWRGGDAGSGPANASAASSMRVPRTERDPERSAATGEDSRSTEADGDDSRWAAVDLEDPEWAELDGSSGSGLGQLADRQLIEVHGALVNSPRDVGIVADRWTPLLVCMYLERTYGLQVSPDDCEILMERSGVDPDESS